MIARHAKDVLASVRMVRKNPNGEVDCALNSNPACSSTVGTATLNDYCWNHVSCSTCRMQVNNPNYRQNVGPLSWQGKACKESGQNVRDFAYEKTKKP
jgi:hypothetical protein